MLRAAAVDRLVVSLSPTIIGSGIEAVGPLGIDRVADGIRLVNRSVFLAGNDVLMGFDVANASGVPEEPIG
jgi:riboflavin biosynthesis pyrimidine reductase